MLFGSPKDTADKSPNQSGNTRLMALSTKGSMMGRGGRAEASFTRLSEDNIASPKSTAKVTTAPRCNVDFEPDAVLKTQSFEMQISGVESA